MADGAWLMDDVGILEGTEDTGEQNAFGLSVLGFFRGEKSSLECDAEYLRFPAVRGI